MDFYGPLSQICIPLWCTNWGKNSTVSIWGKAIKDVFVGRKFDSHESWSVHISMSSLWSNCSFDQLAQFLPCPAEGLARGVRAECCRSPMIPGCLKHFMRKICVSCHNHGVSGHHRLLLLTQLIPHGVSRWIEKSKVYAWSRKESSSLNTLKINMLEQPTISQ